MSVSIKTELEWPYHPADFFEVPYQLQTDAYTIVANAGAVLVTLAAPSDPIDPRLQDQITRHVEGLFLARGLLVHRMNSKLRKPSTFGLVSDSAPRPRAIWAEG